MKEATEVNLLGYLDLPGHFWNAGAASKQKPLETEQSRSTGLWAWELNQGVIFIACNFASGTKAWNQLKDLDGTNLQVSAAISEQVM